MIENVDREKAMEEVVERNIVKNLHDKQNIERIRSEGNWDTIRETDLKK
ncbi:hypothetical protein [Anaerosalibacter sp. Marseille-P3206]|nr:hypothetical protein [Anaerosalibacter sp. Marseille-P3206]